MDLILDAFDFAVRAHHGQERKYTGEPYIVHPIAVARTVSLATGDQKMVAASLLHDTIEDCEVTQEDIERHFGYTVSTLVHGLTEISEPEDGTREERKAIDRAFLARQGFKIHTIKLADRLDNISSIVDDDPEFAKIYMEETRLLLQVLTEGLPLLHYKLQQVVDSYYKIQTGG